MKKIRKLLSLILVTVVLSTMVVSPALAFSVNATSSDFQSVWETVQKMIREQKPAPAPNPTPQPAPAPAPAPAPTPTPTPTPAPAPAPAPAPQPSPGYTISQFEKRVVELVNVERQKAGLKPLVADPLLGKGAHAKSLDMVTAGYFGHTSPKYGSPFNMMKLFGVKYSAAGENIASGQRTPEAVVKAWMNSPGHRANIMSTKYGKIGVGYAYTAKGNYHHYWTQWFTN